VRQKAKPQDVRVYLEKVTEEIMNSDLDTLSVEINLDMMQWNENGVLVGKPTGFKTLTIRWLDKGLAGNNA
jgi:hypothetical protein